MTIHAKIISKLLTLDELLEKLDLKFNLELQEFIQIFIMLSSRENKNLRINIEKTIKIEHF